MVYNDGVCDRAGLVGLAKAKRPARTTNSHFLLTPPIEVNENINAPPALHVAYTLLFAVAQHGSAVAQASYEKHPGTAVSSSDVKMKCARSRVGKAICILCHPLCNSTAAAIANNVYVYAVAGLGGFKNAA